jgi:hypothetical protein
MTNEFHYSDTILPNLYPLIWAGIHTEDQDGDSELDGTNIDRLMALHDEHPEYLAEVEATIKRMEDLGYSIREDFGYIDTRKVLVQLYTPNGKRLLWLALEDLGS